MILGASTTSMEFSRVSLILWNLWFHNATFLGAWCSFHRGAPNSSSPKTHQDGMVESWCVFGEDEGFGVRCRLWVRAGPSGTPREDCIEPVYNCAFFLLSCRAGWHSALRLQIRTAFSAGTRLTRYVNVCVWRFWVKPCPERSWFTLWCGVWQVLALGLIIGSFDWWESFVCGWGMR